LAKSGGADYVAADRSMSDKEKSSGEFLTKELTIANRAGLHARPASQFVNAAKRFVSDIFLEKDGEKISGKSLIGLLLLGIGPGGKVTLYVKGADAPDAIAELEALVIGNFGET
jgi:phosphocarrier protein